MIKIKINKDSGVVAKIIIIDNKNRVLFLTRSKYHEKYAGELDLPGGHLQEGESIGKGLEREVMEETGLKVKNVAFYKTIGNKHFFHTKYDFQPIKLSQEHTDYAFYSKEKLNSSKKFEKMAMEVLEMLDND